MFFSPDGAWIGFWAGQRDQESAGRGRTARHHRPACRQGAAGVRVGERTAPSSSQARRASPKCLRPGEQPATVTTPDAAKRERHLLPYSLPGGREILFTTVISGDWDTANVVLLSLDNGERRVLIPGGADARYVSTGHLVFMKTGTLMAVPFDVRSRQVTGAPVTLVEGVMQGLNALNSALRNRRRTVRGGLRVAALRARWHQSNPGKLVGMGRQNRRRAAIERRASRPISVLRVSRPMERKSR